MADAALDALRNALSRGEPDARAWLRSAVASRTGERSGHAAWARLCEEAGENGLALVEYQLAFRDDPADPSVASRLAVLYEERGDLARACEAAAAWADAAPCDPEAVDAVVRLLVEEEGFVEAAARVDAAERTGMDGERCARLRARIAAARRATEGEAEEEPVGETPFGEADVVRFAHLFGGRENVHARMWCGQGGEVGYSPVREPLTVQVARNHLLGNITVGTYPVRLDNTVSFIAFDLDIGKKGLNRTRGDLNEARRLRDGVAEAARDLAQHLEAMGMPGLIEDSGYKGRHVWVFFDSPIDAAVARQFGTLFLGQHRLAGGDIMVEFFPKQASVAGGVGNLIKLPLGIHRKSGRRSRLLDREGAVVRDPWALLRALPRVARGTLYDAIEKLKSAATAPLPVTTEPEGGLTEEAVRPAPAPPPARPSWTEADYEANPEVAHLLARCPVLGALKKRVDEHRRLTHDEQVVLVNSMGHSGVGVLAVNHLLGRCVDVSVDARLQSPLAGNPISCAKVRKRIPHITGSVDCNCSFEFAPERYPSPRLHLLTLPQDSASAALRAEPTWEPVERARALGVLWTRRRELEREIADLEQDLIRWLQAAGTSEIRTSEGVFRLREQPGSPPAFEWVAEPSSGPTTRTDQ